MAPGRIFRFALPTAGALLLAGATSLAVIATLPQDGRDVALANSDALLAEGLYRDLFADPYPLADWRFSTTTFLFPDAPLYFLARVFTDHTGVALWIFAALLFAATALAAAYTVAAHRASSTLNGGSIAALASTGVGAFIFILANHAGWIATGGWLPDPFMATWHGGTCLAAFVCAGLYQAWLVRPARLLVAALSLTGLLATASDGAFFTMFTAPALAAWFLSARSGSSRRLVAGAAILLIPPLAGRWLLHSLDASGAIRIADPVSRATKNLSGLLSLQTLEDLAAVFAQLSPMFWITSLLCLGWLGVRWFAERGNDPRGPTTNWLYAWVALTIISQPIFTAIAGRLLYDFPWQPRYLLAGLYAPFLFVLPLGLTPLAGVTRRRLFVSASLVAFALGATLTLLVATAPRLTPTTPTVVQCVDNAARARSLRYGLAGYFEAKPLTFYSQTGVVVNQLAPDFAPFYWLNNFAWYLGKSETAIEYDFLVWPKKRAADALSFFGPADQVIDCPDEFQLLIYADPRQARFRRQFSREGLLLWRHAVGLE